MSLTNAGKNLITSAIVGGAYTAYNAANAYIGVGDSNATFDAAHTDLQASTNKLRVGMDSTYPQAVNNEITLRSTFSTSQANWEWKEWGIFNAGSSGTMLNRKVETLGTKTSAQTWEFTVTLTVNNP